MADSSLSNECAVDACTARTLREFCIRCQVNGQAQLQVESDQARETKAAA